MTDTFDKKMAALRAHASQVGGNDQLEQQLRTHLAATAQRFELGDGRLAEEFQVVDTA